MKRSIVFGVLFSTALAAGASAQSTGGQPPSQSGSSDQVTVTGCLLSGGATGSTGTSGAGSTGAGSTGAGSAGSAGAGASRAAESGFFLTNAKMGSGSTSPASGASSTGAAGSPTASSSSGMASMTRFKLEGSQSDLQRYANSQVEISGRLDKSTGGASSTTGSPTTGSSGATGAGSAATGAAGSATGSATASRPDMPTLRVSSVRQVSPTCSGR